MQSFLVAAVSGNCIYHSSLDGSPRA